MFGPDICGAVRKKTHVILGHRGQIYPSKKHFTCYKDHLTHAYTLIIRKNRTIEVRVDGETVATDLLSSWFNIEQVSSIPDPTSVKPRDWVDDPYIIDPDDTKPADWVDEEFIPDPDAFRPPSWDDSIPWAPPMIKDPRYKGRWTPRTIKNPRYKGPWMPKMISVPEPVEDQTFGYFPSLSFLGLEFYQSAPGTIFDNFLVTDDEEYAGSMLQEVFLNIRDAELKCYDRMTKRLAEEKNIEKGRDVRLGKVEDRDKISADVSETEKAKETKEQRAERHRKAKRKLAEKRAAQKNFAEFDSL
jgi:calreticulin